MLKQKKQVKWAESTIFHEQKNMMINKYTENPRKLKKKIIELLRSKDSSMDKLVNFLKRKNIDLSVFFDQQGHNLLLAFSMSDGFLQKNLALFFQEEIPRENLVKQLTYKDCHFLRLCLMRKHRLIKTNESTEEEDIQIKLQLSFFWKIIPDEIENLRVFTKLCHR